MKEAAKFSRENPCTKVHLYNCFRGPRGYQDVPVVEAKTQIGDHAPKYLLREEYAQVVTVKGVDYYRLTALGSLWLDKGIRRYLELHPEQKGEVTQSIPGMTINRTAVKPATRVIVRGRR